MPLVLDSRDIALMRSTGLQALPDTATLMRDTLADDGAGGTLRTPTVVGTYPCNITVYLGRKGGDELAAAEHFLAIQTWRIVLPAGCPVTLTDRLQVAGHTYEVKGVGAGQSLWEVLVEAFCVEVT